MIQVGNRIYYDQDGEIIFQTGEMQGIVPMRKENQIVSYVDLEYGQIDTNKYCIVGIDVASKQPIVEEIVQELTAEQKQIKELEDQLLLATDNEVGGIL